MRLAQNLTFYLDLNVLLSSSLFIKKTSWLGKPRAQSRISETPHLSGEVSPRLELFKEGGQEERGEEENDRPEKNVWDVGPVMTTSRTQKFPFKFCAHLEEKGGSGISDSPSSSPNALERLQNLTETPRLFQGMESGA